MVHNHNKIEIQRKDFIENQYKRTQQVDNGQNSIEAPESLIFSHGQTSTNTFTKKIMPALPLTNNWSKIFFTAKTSSVVRTHMSRIADNIATIRSRVGIPKHNNYCASLCDTLSSVLIENGLQVSLSSFSIQLLIRETNKHAYVPV